MEPAWMSLGRWKIFGELSGISSGRHYVLWIDMPRSAWHAKLDLRGLGPLDILAMDLSCRVDERVTAILCREVECKGKAYLSIITWRAAPQQVICLMSGDDHCDKWMQMRHSRPQGGRVWGDCVEVLLLCVHTVPLSFAKSLITRQI